MEKGIHNYDSVSQLNVLHNVYMCASIQMAKPHYHDKSQSSRNSNSISGNRNN